MVFNFLITQGNMSPKVLTVPPREGSFCLPPNKQNNCKWPSRQFARLNFEFCRTMANHKIFL